MFVKRKSPRTQPIPPGVFLDASVLLADPDIILRMHGKSFPVISTSIRNELEVHRERGKGQIDLDNVDKI
ncbi:MAG: hypothetical protein OXB95_14555, partial [Rhodobacteraceae bacterium]|nr:hypothetical protein [Paracoccaceae bacterium]